jgi:hypothetical protein
LIESNSDDSSHLREETKAELEKVKEELEQCKLRAAGNLRLVIRSDLDIF